MAVNVKYTHTWKPVQAGQYRVNLCDTDFTGSSSDIEMTSQPFQLSWNNDDPHVKVMSSECTLNFIVESEAQADWFRLVAQDQTGRFTVEIREGTAEDLFWVGVIQAEGVSIPYLTPPFVVTLQANDDLARLADSFHNQTGEEGGVPYSDTNELVHTHLRRVLLRLRTQHHWENSDVLVQIFSYYETASGDGLTALKIPSSAWDKSSSTENAALTDLEVLEELCLIFNSRFYQQGGLFTFHSLAHLENAVDFEMYVANYTKGGTLYTPILIDEEYPFSNITKFAGWSTTYVPALHTVKMQTTGGFLMPSGYVDFLPPLNQLAPGDNSLDGTNYNTIGDAQYFELNGAGDFFAHYQSEQTFLDFWLQASFDAFTISAGSDADEVVRIKVSILHVSTQYGGTNDGDVYLMKNTATFDNDNTQPILGESGQSIDVASVTYSTPTFDTTTSNRLVFYSDPIHCGGNNPRGFSQRFTMALPAYDPTDVGNAAVPKIGGLIEVVKHDGTSFSAGTLATIEAAWQQGFILGASMSSTNAENNGLDSMWTASQTTQLFRERLDLGVSSFGIGFNGTAYIIDSAGNVQTDFTSPGNVDGTDFIAQLVVKDVLRMRSLPRELFTGNGLTTLPHFLFNKIYTDSGNRYALLSCTIDGGTNIQQVTFFQLDHDTSVVIDEDGGDAEDFNLGVRVKMGQGKSTTVPITTITQQNVNARSFAYLNDKIQLMLSKLMTSIERKLLRSRILANGANIAQALDPTDTTKPVLKVYTANTGSAQSTDSTSIRANTPSGSETIVLPTLPTSNGSHILTMRTVAGSKTGSISSTVAYGTTAGDVLTMVTGAGGVLEPQFTTPSAGGGGGHYTLTGYAGWKGSAAEWVTINGDTRATSGTSAFAVWPVPEACTVAEFSLYSQGAAGSTIITLYVNGTSTETETGTLTAASTITGTFSTAVSAGDKIAFQIDPTTNPTAMSLVVKFEL